MDGAVEIERNYVSGTLYYWMWDNEYTDLYLRVDEPWSNVIYIQVSNSAQGIFGASTGTVALNIDIVA